ncbi:hemerythrin domain-containing protein [Oxalobacteraceae bacterium OM1]|nr:hemerythrin domain-containing protein [Oxalobacteraceae bacterium OM1]
MEAIDYLTRQHRALEQLLGLVLPEEDPAQRKQLFDRAGDQLTVHLKAEEDIFYPAVKASRTEDILLESLEEHLSLKRLLADLLAMAPDEKTFEAKFKVLKEQTEHHHKEEEENLFPKVRKLMDDTVRQELGQKMAELQARLKRAGEPREAVVNETDSAAPLK